MSKATGQETGFLGLRIPIRMKNQLEEVATANRRNLSEETLVAIDAHLKAWKGGKA